MGKALRKPRPSAPHWHYLDTDNCYRCKYTINQRGCSNCKGNKKLAAELRDKRDRDDKIKLKKYKEEI